LKTLTFLPSIHPSFNEKNTHYNYSYVYNTAASNERYVTFATFAKRLNEQSVKDKRLKIFFQLGTSTYFSFKKFLSSNNRTHRTGFYFGRFPSGGKWSEPPVP